MWTIPTILKCIENMKNSMAGNPTGFNELLTLDCAVVSMSDINELIKHRYGDEQLRMVDGSMIYEFDIDCANNKVNYKKMTPNSLDGCRKVEGQKISKFLSKTTGMKPEEIAVITNDIKNQKYYIGFAASDYRIWYVAGGERAGIGSCMSYPASNFKRKNPDYNPLTDKKYEEYIHPASMYETNSNVRLALLFTSNPFQWDGTGYFPLAGRAIVTVDEYFARVYARNSSFQATMMEMLQNNNFGCHDTILEGYSFEAKSDDCGDLVVPYLDGDNAKFNTRGGCITVDVDDGEYEVSHSDARIQQVDRPYCAHCMETHGNRENTATYYDNVGETDGEIIEPCFNDATQLDYGEINGYTDNNWATFSDYHDHYIHDSHIVNIWIDGAAEITFKGSDVLRDSVDLYDEYEGCEDALSTECIETQDGHWFLKEQQDNLYFRCAIDGEYYTAELHDTDSLEHLGLTINVNNLEITS